MNPNVEGRGSPADIEETLSGMAASRLSSKINPGGLDLKIYLLTTAACSVFLALTVAMAQTLPSNTDLTANPVFKKDCARCHGKTAEGRHFGGPSLISTKTASASSEDLHKVISNGKGRMPKFAGKLTAEEIDTLVQQIQAVNKK